MLLIIGALLILAGGLLMLWTFGYLTRFTALWPVFFILLGLFFLYLVFFRKATEMYTFPGMLMSLGGLYSLLGTSFMSPGYLLQIWPVFMAIAGISIIPYAMMKQGSARVALLVPGAAIVVLALVFLFFSLHLITDRLSHAAYLAWPVLLVVLGIVFLRGHYTRKGRHHAPGEESSGGGRGSGMGGEE